MVSLVVESDKANPRLRENKKYQGEKDYTYAGALKKGLSEGYRVVADGNDEELRPTIFVLNLPQTVMAREVWRYFGYKEDIVDIILPKKRDRNGNRFGFLKVRNMRIAENIIKDRDDNIFLGYRILLKLTKRKVSPDLSTKKKQGFLRKREEGIKIGGELERKDKDDIYNLKKSELEQRSSLIEQPKHRQRILQVEEKSKEESLRSVIGITNKDQWAYELQEKIRLAGYTWIWVRGISHRKFVITYPSIDEKIDMGENFLKDWFLEVKQWNHLDLIRPRLAWVHCEGLPISAWNEENLSMITEEWGQLVSSSHIPLICNMYQKKMICISTSKVLQIDETVKVVIQNVGYWIRLKEAHTCFDSRNIPTSQRQEISLQEASSGDKELTMDDLRSTPLVNKHDREALAGRYINAKGIRRARSSHQ